jgi:hypothetical protein
MNREINSTDFINLLQLLADNIILASEHIDGDYLLFIFEQVDKTNNRLTDLNIKTQIHYDVEEGEIIGTGEIENIPSDAAIAIIKNILFISVFYNIYYDIDIRINDIVEKYNIIIYPIVIDIDGYPQDFKISDNNYMIYYDPLQ